MKRAAALLALLLCSTPDFLCAAEGPPRGAPLFGEGYARLFERPFSTVAALSIRRPGADRNLLLRLYFRDPRRSLIRVAGSAREQGTVALRKDDRIYLFFPRADLLLNLPSSMGSLPLFGSDFCLDDLLALADLPARFIVSPAGEDTLSGIPSLRYRLAPRAPASSLYAEIRLWVARDGSRPLRQEFVSERGKVIRQVVMESDGRLPVPTHWRAKTFGPRGGESELEFRSFERDPPVGEAFFTVEGLRLWR